METGFSLLKTHRTMHWHLLVLSLGWEREWKCLPLFNEPWVFEPRHSTCQRERLTAGLDISPGESRLPQASAHPDIQPLLPWDRGIAPTFRVPWSMETGFTEPSSPCSFFFFNLGCAQGPWDNRRRRLFLSESSSLRLLCQMCVTDCTPLDGLCSKVSVTKGL